MPDHASLPDAGRVSHVTLDELAAKLDQAREKAPIEVTGARDAPEEALANLLTALAALGLIVDSTTAT